MNGIHDMGGMHGLGPIEIEPNEPVFHASWEGRVFAINRALAAWGKWNIDASRHAIERIPAAEYLRMSYYEKWLTRTMALLLERGLTTREEIETGVAAPGAKASPPLKAEQVPTIAARGRTAQRDTGEPAHFHVGQRVRTRNMNPVGHTRLPRYARDKVGTIDRDHGVFVFPDTNAHFQGEEPQHVYSVRFTARELWGDQASPRDSMYLDLFDDYLEPA
jgi:nitrile hydratase beta subunit